MVVASVLFVITYAFASIYKAKGFLSLLVEYGIVLPRNFFVLCGVCLLFGVLAFAVCWLLVKLFLTVFKIYIIPYSEALFVSLLIFACRNILLGCLNLIILFYPVAFAWCSELFFVVTTFPFIAILYYVFDKFYIHISAAPAIFKSYCIFWGIIFALRLFVGIGL